MERVPVVKQFIEFNRATFNNTYDACMKLQDQTEKVAGSFLDQAKWLPEEGRNLIFDWVNIIKKGQYDLKKTVDDSFKRSENIFSVSQRKKK